MTAKDADKLFYPCIICKEKFEFPHEVGEHVEEKHLNESKYNFICEICGKQMATKHSLSKHRRLHTKETPYLCSFCFKPFSFWTQRKKHEETHKVATDFQCQECSVYFIDQETLSDHVCNKETFDCCGKCYETRDAFAEHQKKKHKRQELENKFNCKYCKRSFKYYQYMMLHEKRHIGKDGTITLQLKTDSGQSIECGNKRSKQERDVKCDLCPMKFDSRIARNAHRLTHPDSESQFPCQTCGKILKSKQSRYIHNMIHDSKKHACSFCDKTFTYRQNMRTHERKHTKEKPYECKFCKKTFSYPDSLSSHEKSHTGEKNYKCRYCDRKFTRYGTWKNHERIHTGEKPYTCSYCGKTFAQWSTHKSHEKTHTLSPSARRRKKSDNLASTNQISSQVEEGILPDLPSH